MDALHYIRFPGERDEYRAARNELLEEEIELRRPITALGRRRAALPLGGEVMTVPRPRPLTRLAAHAVAFRDPEHARPRREGGGRPGEPVATRDLDPSLSYR